MDLTNRYIIMCQNAEDIQEAWIPKQCDFIIDREVLEEGLSFCNPGANQVQVVDLYYNESETSLYQQECEDIKDNSTWIPRQDQLQGMVEHYTWAVLLDACRAWFIETDHLVPIKSMEQLWLAFVMHEKFNKKWDGKDWVK